MPPYLIRLPTVIELVFLLHYILRILRSTDEDCCQDHRPVDLIPILTTLAFVEDLTSSDRQIKVSSSSWFSESATRFAHRINEDTITRLDCALYIRTQMDIRYSLVHCYFCDSVKYYVQQVCGCYTKVK